ncbi:AraC family transcriptional regulator [Rhodopirellula halodulae]|uniref:AraC family transcriptional regulator n=1 Tax=Rhodopirellula halodulae TaxID=2894198 RepID=UPI001E2B0AEF|nr:AraC family transcriptional regulator [Rhodopirellula sp. JC737]MCC9656396.1 AraC family transcriptional regulator [Rhodopirellula sp. JC737]
MNSPVTPLADAALSEWRQQVFGSIVNPMACFDLFDFLPQIYMYVKSADGRYLRGNRVMCRVIGVEDESCIIGRSDFDFFPPAIATQYVEEDRRVIASREALTDQIWLVPDSRGVPQIYSCHKVPLMDARGDVVALAGVKRRYQDADAPESGHLRLVKVVQFVSNFYGDPISVADLAEQANLSASQLHREFMRRFQITPNQYIREVRVGVARYLLETTEEPIGAIAANTGFYDQSHLTRQFKMSTGVTPTEYRRQYSPLQ